MVVTTHLFFRYFSPCFGGCLQWKLINITLANKNQKNLFRAEHRLSSKLFLSVLVFVFCLAKNKGILFLNLSLGDTSTVYVMVL